MGRNNEDGCGCFIFCFIMCMFVLLIFSYAGSCIDSVKDLDRKLSSSRRKSNIPTYPHYQPQSTKQQVYEYYNKNRNIETKYAEQTESKINEYSYSTANSFEINNKSENTTSQQIIQKESTSQNQEIEGIRLRPGESIVTCNLCNGTGMTEETSWYIVNDNDICKPIPCSCGKTCTHFHKYKETCFKCSGYGKVIESHKSLGYVSEQSIPIYKKFRSLENRTIIDRENVYDEKSSNSQEDDFSQHTYFLNSSQQPTNNCY